MCGSNPSSRLCFVVWPFAFCLSPFACATCVLAPGPGQVWIYSAQTEVQRAKIFKDEDFDPSSLKNFKVVHAVGNMQVKWLQVVIPSGDPKW